MGTKSDEDPGFLDKARATPSGRLALKIGIGALGTLVIALGIILIPFPGPGWAIVILGLAIWALEFAWAKSLLEFTKARVRSWTRWVARQSRPVRAAIGIAGMIFATVIVWGSLRLSFGIDLLTVIGG